MALPNLALRALSAIVALPSTDVVRAIVPLT